MQNLPSMITCGLAPPGNAITVTCASSKYPEFCGAGIKAKAYPEAACVVSLSADESGGCDSGAYGKHEMPW